MSKPELIIGNKNYSSWSLRPWLAFKVAGIEFDETMVRLFENDWDHHKAKLPSGTVPVLKHEGMMIWETLAILEYMAETWPEAKLWPEDKHARATARSISNEMHAGFPEVRANMPMNIRSYYPGRGRGSGEDASLINRDIRRIEEVWTDMRDEFGKGGDFLFGDFTIADAMFAPIVSRFTTYDVRLNGICRRYMDAILALPAMIEWSDAARAEPWTIKEDEIDFVEGVWKED
ncbi:MAG: glutathione S-transferase family protein [Magnetovibrio sp.]|nr:glutathione S-transferase family protein [Magnetovibrio sp.]